MSTTVMVVEDDRFLQEKLVKLLASEGYDAFAVGSGEEALAVLDAKPVDMIVLDLGLPGMDGLTTCRRIRQKNKLPLLMLTSRAEAADRVLGLESGADDYLGKPFDAMELIARVRSQLRRAREYQEGRTTVEAVIQVDCLRIDFERHEVTVGGRPLDLTAKEFDLLAYLARNRDRAISREQLFDKVWGYDEEFGTNSLDVHIYRIRKKIEAHADGLKMLHTIRGYGYRLGRDS